VNATFRTTSRSIGVRKAGGLRTAAKAFPGEA
jgi:hypothetical protein